MQSRIKDHSLTERISYLVGDVFDGLEAASTKLARGDIPPIKLVAYSPPFFNACDYEVDKQGGHESTLQEHLDWLGAINQAIWQITTPGANLLIEYQDLANAYSPVRAKGQRRLSNQFKKRRPLQAGYWEKEMMLIPLAYLPALLVSQGWMMKAIYPWCKPSSGGIGGHDSTPITHSYVLHFGRVDESQTIRRPVLDFKPFERSYFDCAVESDSVHPCPLPQAMGDLFAEHGNPSKSTILDPFAGRGTMLRAAFKQGSHAVGIDLSDRFRVRAEQYVSQPYQTSLLAS